MRRPLTALALCAALAGGLGACGGGDDEVSDVVPETLPALTAPEDTELPAAPSRETDTTETTTTETAPDETTTGAAPPAAATPPAATAPASGTGGAAPQEQQQGGQDQQPDQGGNSGGFSDFCEQNPGACD